MTLTGHTGTLREIALFKDERILSVSDDKTIKIWNTKKGKLLQSIDVSQTQYEAGSLQDGKIVTG
jgi:WD40 repeat protein